jgi:hypothetical protein
MAMVLLGVAAFFPFLRHFRLYVRSGAVDALAWADLDEAFFLRVVRALETALADRA